MLELKQIQFFTACVQEGSFSRAAEVLYTSQPNVSKIIRELEQELGLQLFERGGRGITPTSDGKTLYSYALEILQREQTISNLSKSRRHNYLRVSFNQSRTVAETLAEYRDTRKENIDIQALEGDTESVMKDVERYRSDIGFAFILDVQLPALQYNLQRRSMICESLMQSPCCLSMGEHNLYSRNRIIKFKEMAELKYIRYSDDFFSLENGLSTIEPALRPAMEQAVISNSGHFILSMLTETEFCNVCVPTFFSTSLHQGVNLAVIEPEIKVHFVAMYRDRPSGEAARFLQYLKARRQVSASFG